VSSRSFARTQRRNYDRGPLWTRPKPTTSSLAELEALQPALEAWLFVLLDVYPVNFERNGSSGAEFGERKTAHGQRDETKLKLVPRVGPVPSSGTSSRGLRDAHSWLGVFSWHHSIGRLYLLLNKRRTRRFRSPASCAGYLLIS
jgi:hypothetical protein